MKNQVEDSDCNHSKLTSKKNKKCTNWLFIKWAELSGKYSAQELSTGLNERVNVFRKVIIFSKPLGSSKTLLHLITYLLLILITYLLLTKSTAYFS